ncbi:hypothetical protein ABH923_001109 [Leifsonia sp. EB41]|uniref:S8 family peptidase n=1 Tax=Leifsonia sp. EB41 TaxID=3156260 RepID=UPI0035145560
MATFSSEPDLFPLLAVGSADGGGRSSRQPDRRVISGPGRTAQGEKFDPKFAALVEAMNSHRLVLTDNIDGHEPEMVVVLEVLKSLDSFRNAAQRVPGLEFLAALDEDAEDLPEGFTLSSGATRVSPTLFVIAQNQAALQELMRLWKRYQRGEAFAWGYGAWKEVFDTLKDVRQWSPEDRIREGGLTEAWSPSIEHGDLVRGEVELWYRRTASSRAAAQQEVVEQLEAAGCRVLDIAEIEEIAYHAILVEMPAATATATIRGTVSFVRNDWVAFVRPQSAGGTDDVISGILPDNTSASAPAPTQATPMVAVLDGVPLLGHQRLAGRFELHDPQDMNGYIKVNARDHGTAVASAVIWGDLEDAPEPLNSRILLRPIFTDTIGTTTTMDPNRLTVNAVKEILDELLIGADDTEPAGPDVKVVVMAVGHTAQPFGHRISPWAKLLDYYSVSHQVLFIVSAGNHDSRLDFGHREAGETEPTRDELTAAAREKLLAQAHHRRILAPADSVNALTVGSSHTDAEVAQFPATAVDLVKSAALPSPTSALGGGYRGGLKPELLAPGGRTLYRQSLREDELVFTAIKDGQYLPGIRAASVGSAGQIDAERRFRGTSFAAALVGHEAARTLELLVGDGTPLVPGTHQGIATKALLVNTADWGEGEEQVATALNLTRRDERRRKAARVLGYGALRPARIGVGAANRATLVASGTMFVEGSRIIEVPIPRSLNAAEVLRRAIITLAWFTPTNPADRRYRVSRLWFDFDNADALGFRSEQAYNNMADKGTIQHEVWEASRPVIVQNDTNLLIRVNSMKGTNLPFERTPFAVAVTFEAEEGIPVYREIFDILTARARVQGARTRVR